jgi:hypothetical protein
MITKRPIDASDEEVLKESLVNDEYHKDTTPMFFVAPNTNCIVYSDEDGPILYARASNALRLDLQFVDNKNKRKNIKTMLSGFPELAAKAKESKYTEIIFNTTNSELKGFCTKAFGFVESGDELRRLL